MKYFFKKYKKNTLCLILFVMILFSVNYINVNREIITPGGLSEVQKVIEIEGGTKLNGSFNTVSVYVKSKVSLLAYFLSFFNPSADIYKPSVHFDMTPEEEYKGGVIQKDTSIVNSIIVAYTEANLDIKYNYEGYIIDSKSIYCDDDLQIGDVITSFENHKLTSDMTYEELMASDEVSKKSEYTVEVNRNGTTMTLALSEHSYGKDSPKPFIGITGYEKYNITQSNPTFEIHKSNTIGPSGGLMQALSTYDTLVEKDLLNGNKVAGTGTINVDGTVGEIGGITQKIFAAANDKAKVFFCPTENYKDAKKAYDRLDNPEMVLVEVKTFDDAINYLEGLNDIRL